VPGGPGPSRSLLRITAGKPVIPGTARRPVSERNRPAFYLDARREEMQAGMRELLGTLDGSRAARIAMLAGMTREELDSVGGVEEDG